MKKKTGPKEWNKTFFSTKENKSDTPQDKAVMRINSVLHDMFGVDGNGIARIYTLDLPNIDPNKYYTLTLKLEERDPFKT